MVNLYHNVLFEMKKENIKNIFNKYKSRKNFMGVYFSNKNNLFITFKNDPELFIKKYNIYNLEIIFDCNKDFDKQNII